MSPVLELIVFEVCELNFPYMMQLADQDIYTAQRSQGYPGCTPACFVGPQKVVLERQTYLYQHC